MIIDSEAQFSDEQDVAATAVGTNTMDLLNTNGDIGVGQEITVEFHIGEAVAAAGAATVQFQIVDDDNAALASAAVVATTDAIAKATLVAGYKVRLTIPAGASTQRYLGVNYVVATGPLTGDGGKISAYVISPGPVQDSQHYFGTV